MKKNWIFFRYDPGRLKKMWLMLKLTSICLLLSVFQLHARSQAVSLNLKNATLQQVIWAIESQTNFIFMYSKDDLDKSGKVSVNLSNEHVEKILEKCLQGTGLTYVIQDEVIVLRPQTRMTLPGKLTLTGLVVDRQGNSLPGVTILLKGTSMGSVTDARGNFKFEIPEMEEMVLVFSFVGMKKKEVIYRGEEVLKIVLEEETAEMEEVVVTGIFERKKESFTGSATTYSSRELKKVGNQNIIQSLKSLDPAFAILENNEAGSDPNHLPDLEIRGKSSIVGLKEQYNVDPNQPLFILDGFETSLQTIMDLDMDRVASITILKDAASTAIYGSKAANGVVVVETVKPEQGKLRVTYSGNFNIQMPDLSSYKLMNSEEKLRFEVLSGYYKSTGASNYMQLQELYNKRLADVRTCSTIPSSPPASRRRSTPCSRATLRAILPSKSAGCCARCAATCSKGAGTCTTRRSVWPRVSGTLWKAASISRNTVSTGSSPRRCAQGSMRPTSRVPSAGPGSSFRGRASRPDPRARWFSGTPSPTRLRRPSRTARRLRLTSPPWASALQDPKSTSASSGRTSPTCSPARTKRASARCSRCIPRSRASAASSASWSSRFVTAFPARASRASSGRGSTAASAPPP